MAHTSRLKYFSDRLSTASSFRVLFPSSLIASFTVAFQFSLVGGSLTSWRGMGSSYLKTTFLSWVVQLLDEVSFISSCLRITSYLMEYLLSILL